MDDYDQEIKFRWRFLLSIPTMYFLAFVIYYYQHYRSASYYNDCDYAEEFILSKADCYANTLFNNSICVLAATQCSFVVSILIYKKQYLKQSDRRCDCWSVFIYTQIAINLLYVISMWFYIATLLLSNLVEQYYIKDQYA